MKRNFMSFAALIMCAAVMSSCSEEEPINPELPAESYELSGDVTEDLTLEAGKKYELSGKLSVKDGAVLTIEEGVTIVAQADDTVVDYIIVEPGAQLVSEATESNPIIMTASKKEHGAWGGVHVCGKATVNGEATSLKSEVGDVVYGGTDDADNSGVYANIRVEYAGYLYSEDKECNGFTFYGVGNGTKLENLVAYKGSDDGYEWFGGTVNGKNLVSIDNEDDSFDWTYGFRGTIENAYAEQLSTNCDHLIEGDNRKNDDAATPVSHPTFKNATLIGINGGGDRGIRIRRGSLLSLENATIYGKTNGLDLQSELTNKYFIETADAFTSVAASAGVVNKDSAAADYTNVTAAQIAGLTVNTSMEKPAVPEWLDTTKALFAIK